MSSSQGENSSSLRAGNTKVGTGKIGILGSNVRYASIISQ